MECSITLETIKSIFTTMLRIRQFEERVVDLLMDNPSEILCPVHLYIGQEAVAAGVCANLRKDDYVLSTHRSHGHYIAKGGDIKSLMAELFCRVTGCCSGRGGSMHLASPEFGLPGSSAIVAGTIPIAVGTALASSLKGKDNVSVVFFGDGAVSEGVWHESLNFSGLKKLPVIFICENNLYSTHMPISETLAETNIYKKADAFAMPGVRVDGNDAFEVYKAVGKAVKNARSGKGSALIECMTYRWRGHVGARYDTDKGVRSQEELDYWRARCPIKTMEKSLLRRGILSKTEVYELAEKIDEEIEEAIIFARKSPFPDEKELLFNVFKG